MKPVFPMIGLEYRYPVPPASQRYFRDFFYIHLPGRPNSTANITWRSRAGNLFKKQPASPVARL
jgi:hypothetical protein